MNKNFIIILYITVAIFFIGFITDSKAQSDRTQFFENWTSKKANQSLSIQSTGSGNIILNNFSGVLKSSSGVVSAGNVDLASEVTGVLPVANGGTGSSSQNFVDLTTAQTVVGEKTFDDSLVMLGIATPANPVAGDYKLYFKTDGNLYKLDSAGSEAQVGGGGGGSETVVTKSSNATLLASGEEVVLCNTSGGNVTLTLPASSGNNGLKYTIKKTSSSNRCIVDGNASETIDGITTYNLFSDDQTVEIQSDGSNWGINHLEPLTCYLKDVKSSSTAGGSFSASGWNNRTLNTTQGECGFLSLGGGSTGTDGTANAFNLDYAGRYQISCSAPAYLVDAHKTKLLDVTGAVDQFQGSSEFNNNSGNDSMTRSFVSGSVDITTVNSYRLQHNVTTSTSGNDGGRPTGLGLETYSQCEIVKMR